MASYSILASLIFVLSHYLTPCSTASLSKLPSSLSAEEDTALHGDRRPFNRHNNFEHPSRLGEPSMSPRFYVAVSVETRKSYFTLSSRFLSVSVSPKRVAGISCIPWDAQKLQVSQLLQIKTAHIGPLASYIKWSNIIPDFCS